jgi:hypothetical protein
MSTFREQAMIDTPVERIWELVGDPNRHPEWWPRVVEADCEDLTEGRIYRQVMRSPIKFGMDPQTPGRRVIDRLAGKRFLRQWLRQSLEALERASAREPA